MDKSTFEKELKKYKVVRLADHYRPRTKQRTDIKSSSKPVLSITSGGELYGRNNSNHHKVNDQGASSKPFYELLEDSLKEFLSPSEVSSFVRNMKKELEGTTKKSVNLEDLNEISIHSSS